MAIINCPECNGAISSTAHTCIHCGCSITVCPECNNVIIGDASVCGECGYRFKTEQAAPKEIVPDIPISEIHDEWRNSKVGIATIFNKYQKIYLIPVLIGLLWICWRSLQVVLNWTNDFYAGKPSNYQGAFNSAKSGFMTLLFVYVILWHVVPEIFKFMKYKELSGWIASKGINTKGLIDKNLTSEIFKLTDKQHDRHKIAICDFIKAHVYEIDPRRKMRDIIHSALKCVVEFVGTYLITNWLLDFTNKYMSNIFWNYSTQIDTGYEPIKINYLPLILYVVIGTAVTLLLNYIFNEDRANKKWVQKELPDKEEYFDVLIKNGSVMGA